MWSQADLTNERVWARYLKEWTMWNHVRTLASAHRACSMSGLSSTRAITINPIDILIIDDILFSFDDHKW